MPPKPTLRARLRWIFTGSTGIRAGWSVLIFLLIMTVPALAISLVAHLMHIKPPGKPTVLRPWMLVIREGVTLIVIAIATAGMGWIEGKRPWYYGLEPRQATGKFLAGWAGGLACLSVLVALMAGAGFLVFDGVALHGLAILGYGALWLFGFFLVGMSEETLFRGYIQTTLTRGMGFWPAAAVTSLLFGAAHIPNTNESVLGLVMVVTAGLVFCLLLRVSGSLWLAIGFHAAWDWAQSYLYGTPDSGMLAAGHLFLTHAAGNTQFSGGKDGPEGSLLAAPVMVAGLLALILAYRRGWRAQEAVLPQGAAQPAE